MLPWWFVLVLTCFHFPKLAKGHARLMSPPSRSSMWRLGFPTQTNFNDNALYCGGIQVQWQRNGGKCGICGDPYDMPFPRDNEAGGKYGRGIISRSYLAGQLIEAIVDVTTNHKGYFEFKICPNNNPKKEASQECLDKHTLRLAEGGTKYYITDKGNGDFAAMLRLPKGLTCSQCVFQWTYVSGNNWGRCADGESGLGCGPQETFRGCADIAIMKNPNSFTYNPSQNDIGYKFHATTLSKSSKQKLFKESLVTKYPKYTTDTSSQNLDSKSTFTTEDVTTQGITTKTKSSKRKRPFSTWMTTELTTDNNERTSGVNASQTNYKWNSSKRSTHIADRNGYYLPTTKTFSDSKFAKSMEHDPTTKIFSYSNFAKNMEHGPTTNIFSDSNFAKSMEHGPTTSIFSDSKLAKNTEHGLYKNTDSTTKMNRLSFSRSPSVLVLEKGTQLSNMLQQLEGDIQLLRFYLQEDPATSTQENVYGTPTETIAGTTNIVKDFWYL